MNKVLTKILRKMCELANVEYDPNLFNLTNFYLRHTWSIEKAEEFVDWLSNEIYTDKETWKFFGFNFKPSKDLCYKLAKDFETNYGWSYKTNTIKE